MNLMAILKALTFQNVLPPETKNNGAFAGLSYADTQELSAIMFLIAAGVTDVIVGSGDTSTPPLVEECDTYDGSYTAVTDAELSAVCSATDDDKMWAIHVDLTKTHKRYMRIKAPTAGNSTGASFAIIAIGFPKGEMLKSASDNGLAELIEA